MLLQTPQRTGRRPPLSMQLLLQLLSVISGRAAEMLAAVYVFRKKMQKKSPFAWTFMGLEPIDNDTVALGAWRLTDILDNLRDDTP